jgi:hypothetical protein
MAASRSPTLLAESRDEVDAPASTLLPSIDRLLAAAFDPQASLAVRRRDAATAVPASRPGFSALSRAALARSRNRRRRSGTRTGSLTAGAIDG